MCTMEFNTVKASFHGSCSSCPIACDNLFDLLFCNSGKCDLRCNRHVRRNQNLGSLVHTDSKGTLPELDSCISACLVDRICESLQSGNVFVITDGKKMAGSTRCVHAGNFNDIQAAAALHACNMIVDQLICHIAVISGKLCSHSRQYNAVRQLQVSDPDGGKQFIKHTASPFP